jgi:hypothetical protein
MTEIFDPVDAGPAIQAAFAAGERTIHLRPHTRWVTALHTPGDCVIVGETDVVIGDGALFFGGAGPRTVLVRVIINDPNAQTPGGNPIGWMGNFTGHVKTLSGLNHQVFDCVFCGVPGSSNFNGGSFTWDGPGTGDLFFGQVVGDSHEWRDAIYRGDLSGGGPSGGGIGPGKVFAANLWAQAHPEQQGLEIRDERPSAVARQFKISSLRTEAGIQMEHRGSGVGYVFSTNEWGDFTVKNDTTGTPAIVLTKSGEIQFRQHDTWWGFNFATGQWVRRQ